jgi:hypothetical protein
LRVYGRALAGLGSRREERERKGTKEREQTAVELAAPLASRRRAPPRLMLVLQLPPSKRPVLVHRLLSSAHDGKARHRAIEQVLATPSGRE